jgi:hypothetical protein
MSYPNGQLSIWSDLSCVVQANEASDAASKAAGDAQQKASDAAGAAQDKAGDMTGAAKEKGNQLGDQANQAKDQAGQKVSSTYTSNPLLFHNASSSFIICD